MCPLEYLFLGKECSREKSGVLPEGGLLFLPPTNPASQPGRKADIGDLFSGAVSLELRRTLGTPLTGECKTMWTGLCSVGEL